MWVLGTILPLVSPLPATIAVTLEAFAACLASRLTAFPKWIPACAFSYSFSRPILLPLAFTFEEPFGLGAFSCKVPGLATIETTLAFARALTPARAPAFTLTLALRLHLSFPSPMLLLLLLTWFLPCPLTLPLLWHLLWPLVWLLLWLLLCSSP